jgi:benzoyl-CoA reductase/2-hydroxyglutaryl-CoA dehydratase subunit BcrC/BadD/HgdB
MRPAIADNLGHADPPAARVDYHERNRLFRDVSMDTIRECWYYREYEDEFGLYLFPPNAYAIYGNSYLKKLEYDNGLASLRLWGFVMSQSERLYRARQVKKKVVACMADLGGTAPIVYALPNGVAFYPDCFWWTPFYMESKVLFNDAARFGMGEDCCYSRASLGAFWKLAYFPRPDLVIAGSGASCDDFASVTQHVEGLGHNLIWWEIPHRRTLSPSRPSHACHPSHSSHPSISSDESDAADRSDPSGSPHMSHASRASTPSDVSDLSEWSETLSGGTPYPSHLLTFIRSEFARVRRALEKMSGTQITDDMLRESIRKQNHIRRLINEIRDLVYLSPRCPLPALEMLLIEFLAVDAGADPDECIELLEHLKMMVARRVERGEGVLPDDAVRVIWIGPPADMLLLNLFEDLGGHVVGSEYMINQTRHLIPESPPPLTKGGTKGGCSSSPHRDSAADPLAAIADAFLNASLIGGARYRAEKVIEEARRANAQGIVYSGIFGGSHCLAEDRLIAKMAEEELGIPTLCFDVPFPTDTPHAQLRTRIETFLETVHKT